jgi:hypothetical protein
VKRKSTNHSASDYMTCSRRFCNHLESILGWDLGSWGSCERTAVFIQSVFSELLSASTHPWTLRVLTLQRRLQGISCAFLGTLCTRREPRIVNGCICIELGCSRTLRRRSCYGLGNLNDNKGSKVDRCRLKWRKNVTDDMNSSVVRDKMAIGGIHSRTPVRLLCM